MIVDAITFSNPDFQLVLQLARQNPIPADWESLPADEVTQLESLDLTGVRLITDSRILDVRLPPRIVFYQTPSRDLPSDGCTTVDREEPADGEDVGKQVRFRMQ